MSTFKVMTWNLIFCVETMQETVCMWAPGRIPPTSPPCTAPVAETALWSTTSVNPCSYQAPAASPQVCIGEIFFNINIKCTCIPSPSPKKKRI